MAAPDTFAQEIEALIAEIPRAHQRLLAELGGAAIDDVSVSSPVRTGAYRASHTVTGDGGAGPGPILYEGADRIGDDDVVPEFPHARYQPVSGDDARAQVEAAEPFQRIEIRNGTQLERAVHYRWLGEGDLQLLDSEELPLTRVRERADGSLELYAADRLLLTRIEPASAERIRAGLAAGQPALALLQLELGPKATQLAQLVAAPAASVHVR